MSCKKLRSPKMAMALLRCEAIPSAVEIFPSMPASPRLAKVSMPVRAEANPSISLMGRDDEINSVVESGSADAISRATRASDHCVIPAIIFDAL